MMKRTSVMAILMIAMIASAQAVPMKLKATGDSTLTCFIGVISTADFIGNPGAAIQGISGCAGDQTWSYVSGFIGGVIRPLANLVWGKMAGATDAEKGISEL